MQFFTSHWYFVGAYLWIGLFIGLPCGVGRANKVVLGVPKYARRNFYTGTVIGISHYALAIVLNYFFDDDPLDAVLAAGLLLIFVGISVMCVIGAYTEIHRFPDQGSVLRNEWRHWQLMMWYWIRLLVVIVFLGLIIGVYQFLTR